MFSFSIARTQIDTSTYLCRSITFRFFTKGTRLPFLENSRA